VRPPEDRKTPGMHQLLAGKVAVITGAGRGIGKECVKVFVREGAAVLALDISGAENNIAAEMGSSVVPFHADVSQEPQVKAAFDLALERFGRIDSVLNVAGTVVGRTSREVSVAEFEAMIAVNLLGVLLCSQQGVRAMLASGRGGSILNFTSVGGLNAEERAPLPYAAAKAGVHSVTKAFAIDYGHAGIRCNAIAPGFAYTEIMEGMSAESLTYMSGKAALKRAGRAQELAEVAVFLASDRASFVTGAIIPVDGGWSARLA
jgi:NAD(P)-dependent dehydrogenase (short-subunit alcohol dehydrogenase family)